MTDYQYYSIIVPCFDRREEILELLDSFMLLEFPSDRFELIIADDGSSDGTDQLVNHYQPKVSFPLHFYRQQNEGPGSARNMGMRHAKGDFYIFIDSDCTVAPGWLRAIDDELRAEGGDAFGGPDASRPDFPPLLQAIDYAMTSFITTGGIRGHNKHRLGKYYPRSFNMGLSKATYQKVGGFGGLRHGQDIEFSNRIIKSDAKILKIAEAIVYHKRRTSLWRFFKQVFNWGVARVNLSLQDRSMLEAIHLAPAIVTLVAATVFLFAFIPTFAGEVSRWLIGFGILILAMIAFHGGLQRRNWRVSLFLLPVLPLQAFGYGAGMIAGFIMRILLKRDGYGGITNNYYK